MLLTQAKAKETEKYYAYHNDSWAYKDHQDGYFHLFRDGKELTAGLEAIDCYSYQNNDWSYTGKDGYEHLFRNGKELTAGIQAIWCYSHWNGNWDYVDEADYLHEIIDQKTS